jgi:Cu(I)/Ag(I) efflux system periplasmic protein CusF
MTSMHSLIALISLAGASLIAAAPPALAQTSPQAPAAEAASALPQVEAEVRKVDAAAGKVTLKHGDLPNLDMPGMTMVFHVKNTTQLNGLKAGDRVLFRADKVNGAYLAFDITPQR